MEEREADPLEPINVHVPGRMMAVEILLVLLLRQKSNVGRLLREADEILSMLEANEMAQVTPEDADQALKVFQAARASLDNLSTQARLP